MELLLFINRGLCNNESMCDDSYCLIKILIAMAVFFLVLLFFLLRTSRKKQEKMLTLQVSKVWKDYSSLSQIRDLSIQDFLLGIRKDQSLTRFSLLVRSILGEETQINLGSINNEYTFNIQNKKYKVSRKASWRSKLILTDVQNNEIMKFESLGFLGLNHHFFNSQYDFRAKFFWEKMSSGYQYFEKDRQVGFTHPLYGNKNYGQILVLDTKIPLEFRIFILVVNWMGL